MRSLLPGLLLCCIFQSGFSQLSGKLTTAGGQPIPFANVLLLKSTDTSLVKAALTNEQGIYSMEHPVPGKYILRYSSIGYQPWQSPVFELANAQKTMDWGTQVMTADKKQLDEVVVRAAKPLYQQLPEGMVINVESSVLTKGSSAFEVLERSPGVVMDYQHNSIALNGKNGVMVMMNGKLMRMPLTQVVALLKSISANDIEKIELLTTPPAGYDAEGSAGIIHIVLKKTRKQGTSGTVSVTAGYGRGEKGTGSIHLAHNTNKTGLYGSYSFLHDKTYSNMHITSSQNMPSIGGNMEVVVIDTTKAIQHSHDVTAGFDIKLNPATTIGSNITFNSSVRSTDYFNRLDFKVQPDSLLFFHGYNAGKNHWRNFTGSLYAERNIQEGGRIHFEIDYLWYKNDNPYEVQGSFLDKDGTKAGNNDTLYAPRQRGFANTGIQVGVVKMDYTKQLNKKLKLEAGLKGTYTQTASGSGIESLVNGAWVSRTETIDNIVMKEGIGAGYASFRAQINPLTTLVIGMRYEHGVTGMNDPTTGGKLVDRKRGVLFPNISFSRKLGDQAELQLSFSKRISRPSYNDLAAFVRYSDPTAVLTGNPLLQPTITHNVKMGYNYRDYTFSLLYSRDDNPIARYQLTQNSQQTLLYVSPQNAAWQQNITFQTNVPLKVNEWWNMNYSFVGGWRQCKMEYTLQPVKKNWFGYSVNFNQSFKLPKSFVAEVSGWYNSTTYNGTIKVGGCGMLNAGIKKELKNNGGNIQLSVTDLLSTFRIKVYFGTVTKEVFAIQNDVTLNLESRTFPIIRLTYTKSFGSLKSQRKTDTGTSDERDRIRKDQ